MTKEETYISFIIDSLRSGQVSFERTFELFKTKYNSARPTFAKYWKLANARYAEMMQEVERAKTAQSIEDSKEAVKRLHLTRDERIEIACKIAIGTARRVGGEIIIPSDGDRLKALDYLSKIDGDYAPNKVAATTVNGEDLLSKLIKIGGGIEFEE